jgi:hypothetical protein
MGRTSGVSAIKTKTPKGEECANDERGNPIIEPTHSREGRTDKRKSGFLSRALQTLTANPRVGNKKVLTEGGSVREREKLCEEYSGDFEAGESANCHRLPVPVPSRRMDTEAKDPRMLVAVMMPVCFCALAVRVRRRLAMGEGWR